MPRKSPINPKLRAHPPKASAPHSYSGIQYNFKHKITITAVFPNLFLAMPHLITSRILMSPSPILIYNSYLKSELCFKGCLKHKYFDLSFYFKLKI